MLLKYHAPDSISIQQVADAVVESPDSPDKKIVDVKELYEKLRFAHETIASLVDKAPQQSDEDLINLSGDY